MDKEVENCLHHVIALENAIKYIYETDLNNVWRFSSFKVFIIKYNFLAKKISELTESYELISLFSEDMIGSTYKPTATTQKGIFDSLLVNTLTLRCLLETKLKYSVSEIDNIKNFLNIKLRTATFLKPEKEKDVQDTIESLFIGRGLSKAIDYGREVGRVKVSAKEVIPDFIFPRLSLAIEVKLVKDQMKMKSIIDEINSDIQSYSKSYMFLLFVVYDLGYIRDELEFKTGLDDGSKVSLIVVKH